MKKNILLLFLCLFFICPNVFAACQITQKAQCSCECVKLYKKYVMYIQRNRAIVYNALNLTDEQIKAREEILAENEPLFNEKFDELEKEYARLSALKKSQTDEFDICRQKHIIKKIQKQIECLTDKENKAFCKCLTREQRSKYKKIEKLAYRDYKNDCKKKKDYYKSNPKMRPFGNPQYPCECDKN